MDSNTTKRFDLMKLDFGSDEKGFKSSRQGEMMAIPENSSKLESKNKINDSTLGSSVEQNIERSNNSLDNFDSEVVSGTHVSVIKRIIHHRIGNITNINYFIQNYVSDIHGIFSFIESQLCKKISSIVDKNKYFIRFFKEITTLYETFSLSLLDANNIISIHVKPEQEQDFAFHQISQTIENTQENISNHIYEYSKILQKQIILEGPLSNEKIKQIYSRLEAETKEIQVFLIELNKKKDQATKKYAKYEILFENFKKIYNDHDKLSAFLNKYDFFWMEVDYFKSVNKLYNKSALLVTAFQKTLSNLKAIAKDFLNLLKDAVNIYITESKKMHITEALGKCLMENLTILTDNNYDLLKDSTVDKSLNALLHNFQTDLIKYTFMKNEEVYNEDSFKVDKYHSYEELAQLLCKVFPEQIVIHNSSLLQLITPVKKVGGLFTGNKDCLMVVTIQQSLIIFEGGINKRSYEVMDMKNSRMKKIAKYPLRFEISHLKKGLIYNSTQTTQYDVDDETTLSQIEKLFEINISN